MGNAHEQGDGSTGSEGLRDRQVRDTPSGAQPDLAAAALARIAAARPQYLSSRRADVTALLLAHEAGDHEALRNLGHRMKGTGASYGFPDITLIGALLETSGRECDRAAAASAIERLRAFLDGAQRNTARER